jgi:hypothetical protein
VGLITSIVLRHPTGIVAGIAVSVWLFLRAKERNRNRRHLELGHPDLGTNDRRWCARANRQGAAEGNEMRKKGKMPPPSGNYMISNILQLYNRANQNDDPRHVFYKAILNNETYEGYIYAVRGIAVSPDTPKGTYHKRPVIGHAEFLYARRQSWIEN